VSAVQSRPCPPLFHAFSEHSFRTVTELSPELSLSGQHAFAARDVSGGGARERSVALITDGRNGLANVTSSGDEPEKEERMVHVGNLG
jgi:hypothetical protein